MSDAGPDTKKPLSIAFVSQYFFPEQFSNNAITEELIRRGHSVDVITGVPNYGRETFFEGYSNSQRREEDWKGARVHRARSVARGKSKLRLLLNYVTFPVTGTWTALRKVKRRPDVSFVSMPSPPFQALPAIMLKWFRGVPTVYWVQDIWPETAIETLRLKNPLVVRALSAVCGWLFRRADLVLVQSAAFPPMISRFGIAENRIRVLPNTAPAMYRPMAATDAPDAGALVPGAGFRVMFAGNIGESQDFDTLLATAHLLRNRTELHWVIIGSGRDLERVRKRAHELGITGHFHLLGRHPEESMPGFFAQADALIVSLRDSEIFNRIVPYKVQCYMACGRPILAAIGGEGTRVIAASGAGITAPPSQPEALAEAVTRLMDLPEDERQAMGARARDFYESQYSAEQVYGDLEAWLREAAAKRR
ncbi:glycosyltransferase family 4 protein [Pseudogemmobacter faecipullorum]|uniref:Glycosyltransferase family 4 protein n=1 Tax=Pseudogemmobacter faecipullorum TaxID=2755041 RepID=A0ABS8CRE2_9RHOB|nr:glycosyltransferase family 4 protein [Pseudogemmobacter faecipullorum]MCB5411970.1 glycosyltransferase family 4 protein [Pseudogemmobacter faecipullorum]